MGENDGKMFVSSFYSSFSLLQGCAKIIMFTELKIHSTAHFAILSYDAIPIGPWQYFQYFQLIQLTWIWRKGASMQQLKWPNSAAQIHFRSCCCWSNIKENLRLTWSQAIERKAKSSGRQINYIAMTVDVLAEIRCRWRKAIDWVDLARPFWCFYDALIT